MTLWWYEGQGWRLWNEMESCWKGVQARCSLVQLPEGTIAQCGGPCSKCSPCQPIYINYQPTFCCPLKRTLRDKVKNSSISKDILLSHIHFVGPPVPTSVRKWVRNAGPSFLSHPKADISPRERERVHVLQTSSCPFLVWWEFRKMKAFASKEREVQTTSYSFLVLVYWWDNCSMIIVLHSKMSTIELRVE